MAGSVWLTEVDTALLGFIPTLVKYHNGTDFISAPVMIRTPENEYAITTFPSVSISNISQNFAGYRYSPNLQIASMDKVLLEATMEQMAVPYDLTYQIDFWAKYQEDINEMSRRWVANMRKSNLLTVIDTEGVEQTSRMILVDMAIADYTKGTDRIFHRVYSYRIKVELDESPASKVKVVGEFQIRRVDSW